MPHLADGDVDVERSMLADGEAGVDQTVAKMSDMAKGIYGARSAKIRALAINIIEQAGVGDKDYYGYAKAIHNWVRDEIRYVKDPVGQETLSYPEETAFNSKAEDCDGKTILEMAILGAVGIRSYPVVVGMRKGSFSHVYLHIIIPEGGRPGRHAGEHIAADPIMREWPLGQAVPDAKIQQKKTYEDLSGLGNMALNGYQSGPSYLDEGNVASVPRALARGTLVDTASRGEILNAPKVDEHNTDELDDMFTAMPELAWQATPWGDMGPLGPITGAEASGEYSKLKHRTYERAVTGVKRSFTPSMRRVTDQISAGKAGLAPSGVMIDNPREAYNDLKDLGTYIDSIMGLGLGAPPDEIAAVVHLARNRVARVYTGRGFMPGMGEVATTVAKKANNLTKLSVAVHGPKVHVAARKLEHRGVIKAIDRTRTNNAYKIMAIQVALYNDLVYPPRVELHDEPAIRSLNHGMGRSLSKGLGRKIGHNSGKLHRQRGEDPQLGSWFSNLTHGVGNVVKRVSAPVTKLVHPLYEHLPTPLKKTLAVAAAIPLSVVTAPLALIGASKPGYALNRAAFGDKWGGRIANAERNAAAVVAVVATAGAAMQAFPGAAAAPLSTAAMPGAISSAGGLTGEIAVAADGTTASLGLADGSLMTVPTSSLGALTDASGAIQPGLLANGITGAGATNLATLSSAVANETPLMAADMLPVTAAESQAAVSAAAANAPGFLSTAGSSIWSGLQTVGGAVAAHPWITAGIVGGGLLASSMGKKKPKQSTAADGSPIYQNSCGQPITKDQYDILTANPSLDTCAGPAPVPPSPYPPVDPNQYNGSIDPNTGLPYGTSSQPYQSTDPYGGAYGSPDASAPVDTFGPGDMSAPFESESATSDQGMPGSSAPYDPSGGGQSYSDQVVSSDSGMPDDAGADDGSGYDDSSAADDATEGSAPAPAPRRRKHRKHPVAVAAADDSSDDDTGADDSDELDDSSARPDRNVAGFGDAPNAGISLGTIALVGLAAYLLMKKRK